MISIAMNSVSSADVCVATESTATWSYSTTNQSQPTLYERLGGVYRHRHGRRRPHRPCHGRPAIECEPARGRSASGGSLAGFKDLVTRMDCCAAGGSRKQPDWRAPVDRQGGRVRLHWVRAHN